MLEFFKKHKEAEIKRKLDAAVKNRLEASLISAQKDPETNGSYIQTLSQNIQQFSQEEQAIISRRKFLWPSIVANTALVAGGILVGKTIYDNYEEENLLDADGTPPSPTGWQAQYLNILPPVTFANKGEPWSITAGNNLTIPTPGGEIDTAMRLDLAMKEGWTVAKLSFIDPHGKKVKFLLDNPQRRQDKPKVNINAIRFFNNRENQTIHLRFNPSVPHNANQQAIFYVQEVITSRVQ